MATLKDYALTTLDDVKELLGVPSSTHTYDNLITRKINQATAVIEGYCGRRFKAADYTEEIYNATQGDQLVLRQRPLIIDGSHPFSIQARTTGQNQDDFETIDSDNYFADAESGVIDLNFRAGGHWGSFAVSYRAGYDTIPDDLAEACASLAAYFVNHSNPDVNVRSKQEGQRKVDYYQGTVSTADLLAQLGIDTTLDLYANIAVFADK
jgi:phage gp36-like protein